MADTCRFFEQNINNIANFFPSDRIIFAFFTKQKQFSFYESVYTPCTLRNEKLQIVKEKMKLKKSFLQEHCLYIVLLCSVVYCATRW